MERRAFGNSYVQFRLVGGKDPLIDEAIDDERRPRGGQNGRTVTQPRYVNQNVANWANGHRH
jgi:hypothetical protein